MKIKMIIGISLAAALGASAVGATLVCKPAPINNTVYSKTVPTIKNAEKEDITLYVPNRSLINKENLATAINDGKKYIPMTPSIKTGNLIPVASYGVKIANTNVKDATSLGDATIKKCNNPANIANSKGQVFYMPCTKVETKLPIGTKLKVLWTGKFLVSYNSKDHKCTFANIAAVDYNGELAFISDDYLNMDNVATGTKAMQLASKNELTNAHYIGTSKVIIPFGSTIDPLTHKPYPVDMIVPVNGSSYNLNVRGKTINVINYGEYVHDILKSNEMIGETFGPYSKIIEPKYAKVEYDGIIGYIDFVNLSNTPKSVLNSDR